ncbi:MAG: hypothetical protein HY921_07580 [Elusimicrobia bacterium]|nr:hypothetical protein [Elusimicrobiota bacterium]
MSIRVYDGAIKSAKAAGLAVLGLAAAVGLGLAQTGQAPTSATKDSSLYPNDFGPAEIDVSSYPKEQRQGYRDMVFKCAACHTPARPINAQFLELTEEEERKAKKEDPELFKDEKLVKVEEKLWSRYIKRMMAKPGCPVSAKDGSAKRIYDFLVYDSKFRKMGENGKAFRKMRSGLLDDFKKKHKDVYDKLYVEK